ANSMGLACQSKPPAVVLKEPACYHFRVLDPRLPLRRTCRRPINGSEKEPNPIQRGTSFYTNSCQCGSMPGCPPPTSFSTQVEGISFRAGVPAYLPSTSGRHSRGATGRLTRPPCPASSRP